MKFYLKRLHKSLFNKYLLATNIISSGILMSVGDVMSQEMANRKEAKQALDAAVPIELEGAADTKALQVTPVPERAADIVPADVQRKPIDWSRNAKMFAVGAVQGPLHHYFYGWLDGKYVAATIRNTSIKILYDQVVMSPVCIVAFFYPAGWMFGQTTAECNNEFKQKFLKVYVTDWLIWPATQFINFYYLAPQYRVIYVNAITMLYNVFLSHVKHELPANNRKSVADGGTPQP